ncbi:MAG: dihydrodipicolinate synthase family protein [Mycobacteriaceae bacterium]
MSIGDVTVGMPVRAGELLHGVLPVLLTPFDDAGALDLDGLGTVTARVLSAGARTVMYPGYASEFYRLSETERSLGLAEVVQVASQLGGSVVASVSDQSTVVAEASARRAIELGCAAVNVLPPTMFGGDTEQVRRHLAAVLEACAPLPVVIQHAPALTGSSLSVEAIRQLTQDCGNLVAVKVETYPAGRVVSELRAAVPEVACLVGFGGLHALDGLVRGASGIQPGCSFTEVYLSLWRTWQGSDVDAARRLHTALLPYLTYWMQDVRIIVQVEKLIARRRGWIASDHCRAPDRPLDGYETQTVDRFLEEFASLLDDGDSAESATTMTGRERT